MVEDSEDDALLIIRELKKDGYNPMHERVETAAAMKRVLKKKQWDIILCDYEMPTFNAPSAIALLKEANIDIPLIIVTGKIGEETAADCMRLGAKDYVMKGNLSRLCPAIARELEDAKVRNKQKQADEALRESASMLQITIDDAPVCVAMVDLDKRFLKCNKTFCNFLGYSEKEMQQKTIADITFPEDLEIGMADFRAIVAGEKKSPILQKRYVRKDKAVVWGEVNINLIRNNQGQPMYLLPIIIDITERKLAEAALLESESRFRAFMDNMPSMVIIKDKELRPLFFNRKFSEMFPANEWLGKMPEETFSSEIADSMRKNDLKALSEGLVTYEEDWRDKDGCLRVLETRKFSIDQKDKAPFLGVIITDITERKKAEQTLRESDERFRSMIQSLSDIIFILDGNGHLTYESPSATRILGYQPGYFIGKSPFTHIHPDDLDQVMKELDEVFLSVNSGIPTEFRYQKADDTWIYLEALGINQFENPGIQGIVLTVRDITAHKQAEEKLQHTLNSLKKAVGTTIQVLVSAVESRDPYTAGHQSRVADLACAIATEMGLPQNKIEGLQMAGSIHDIGKLSIPAEILSKPTKLTEIEFFLIKEHSRIGYEMLKDVESPWPLAQIVYQHHERMNGSGYPRNLKGDDILIEARIMAVADVVEAMGSHRPYRPTLGIEAALEEITKNKGILYDDTVADTCLKLFREKGYQLK
jgi:PAS domain S-box-containing protein